MAALATLAIVWLGTEKPGKQVEAAIDAWGVAHDVSLAAPRREMGGNGGEAAQVLAERCNEGLDQARDQLNGGDDDGARHTLERLEQTLRDHPEVQQASWLMAERYRLEAQIVARTSPEDAAIWRARADALEGERAAAFGEMAPAGASPGSTVPITLAVHGARKYEVYWDGVHAAGDAALPIGEHHLVIVRGGHAAWSGWVSVLSRGKIDVWVPDAPACSATDLEEVASRNGVVVTPAGVRCEAWAAFAPGPKRGSLSVAICQRDKCQASATWIYEAEASPTPAEPATKRLLPAWATWTLAGVGVAAATSIILWRTGAFEPDQTPKVRYDGSRL